MAKQEAKPQKTPVFYHGDLLTDAEKKTKSYTYNWKDVTAEEHLEIRKKQLKDEAKNEPAVDAPPAAESLS